MDMEYLEQVSLVEGTMKSQTSVLLSAITRDRTQRELLVHSVLPHLRRVVTSRRLRSRFRKYTKDKHLTH